MATFRIRGDGRRDLLETGMRGDQQAGPIDKSGVSRLNPDIPRGAQDGFYMRETLRRLREQQREQNANNDE